MIAGYKATIKSERTSSEAKAHAEEMIAALEDAERQSLASVDVEGPAGGHSHDEDVHHHRVVGGLKASLKNSHTSGQSAPLSSA